jgi:hypothetical protein
MDEVSSHEEDDHRTEKETGGDQMNRKFKKESENEKTTTSTEPQGTQDQAGRTEDSLSLSLSLFRQNIERQNRIR